MANEKTRPGTNKRRFCDMIADDPNDGGRPNKRISPFHNTPIQKKETKRRILKISLKKMKSIECPETFLRRSVLINNLARSLQDDLRDDKLWDRWGWECDLDTFPNRSPHPVIQHRPTGYDINRETSTTCTLLTNACTSSSATNQWTLSTHAHWINGDDDAHLSPSERERVTRDLAQSHDRLAQTVERLTSFNDQRTAENQTVANCGTKDNCDSVKMKGSAETGLGQGLGAPAGNEMCSCGSPLVSRFSTDGLHHQQSHNDKSCSNHKCSRHLTISKVHQCVTNNVVSSPTHTRISVITHPSTISSSSATSISGYGLSGGKSDFCANPNSPSKAEETWTLLQSPNAPGCAYSRQFGSSTSYDQDMTSHGFPSELSLLGTPLVTCSNSSSTLEPSHHPGAVDGILDSNGNDCSDKDSAYTAKRPFSVPPCHVTSDMTLTDLWSPDPILDTSGIASPATVTCSAEVDRPSSYSDDHASPYATMTSQTDQDKFTSQAVRDFDVIYNNLVSVLIGGN